MTAPIDLVVRLRTSIGPDVFPAMSEAARIIERLNRWVESNDGEPEDDWGFGYASALARVRAELGQARETQR